MTSLTIKSTGKGNTFQAELATILKTLSYYAANEKAICYYKNQQGWQKMSVAVAVRYAHVIGYSERIVVLA